MFDKQFRALFWWGHIAFLHVLFPVWLHLEMAYVSEMIALIYIYIYIYINIYTYIHISLILYNQYPYYWYHASVAITLNRYCTGIFRFKQPNVHNLPSGHIHKYSFIQKSIAHAVECSIRKVTRRFNWLIAEARRTHPNISLIPEHHQIEDLLHQVYRTAFTFCLSFFLFQLIPLDKMAAISQTELTNAF